MAAAHGSRSGMLHAQEGRIIKLDERRHVNVMSDIFMVYWATAQVLAVFAPAIMIPCLVNLAVDRQGKRSATNRSRV